MLSARELEPVLAPPNAQTWSISICSPPMPMAWSCLRRPGTGEGFRQRPPGYPCRGVGRPCDQPAAPYIGQGENVRDRQDRDQGVDYRKGSENVYSTDDGADGVAIGGTASKRSSHGISAIRNPAQPLHHRGEPHSVPRNVQERVETIAPFLLSTVIPTWSSAKAGWSGSSTPIPRARGSQRCTVFRTATSITSATRSRSRSMLKRHGDVLPDPTGRPVAAMSCNSRADQAVRRYADGSARMSAIPRTCFLPGDMYRAYHMDAPRFSTTAKHSGTSARAGDPGRVDQRRERQHGSYYIMMRLPGESRAEFFLCRRWRRASARR